MTYLALKSTRCINVVAVGANLLASLFASSLPSCSGSIEQILSFDATHRFQESAKPYNNSILPQSPLNTQHNRGLFGTAFAAIGGAV